MNDNEVNPFRRKEGEEFEYYVERQFLLQHQELNSVYKAIYDLINFSSQQINERLTKMATLAEQLGVEETILAEVVPKLANVITTLQSTLSTKETELKTDISNLAADSTELATKNAELATIQKVQESLAPVVEEAQKIVTPTTPPVETPVTETPATPPVETPPAEQPATPPAETAPVETPVEGTPPANPEG